MWSFSVLHDIMVCHQEGNWNVHVTDILWTHARLTYDLGDVSKEEAEKLVAQM